MMSQLRPAIVMIALFTVLTGLVFPLGFAAVGKLAFPHQAGGSLITRDGRVVGSSLIGQNFTSARYFQGRVSALTGADPKDSSKQVSTPYDASESGASNLGPTSKTLIDRVTADVAKLGGANSGGDKSGGDKSGGDKLGGAPVPGDMVTSSASGLDPDISPENAAGQVARIAKARGMSEASVQALLAAHTAAPSLGFIGSPRVNVLLLNLALDAAQPPGGGTRAMSRRLE